MLKKSLLVSITLISLNSVQAAQTMHPQHAQHPTQQHPTHHDPAHSAGSGHCPPCPCGGVGGWVLLPAGPGTPCHQGAAKEKTEEHHATPHHTAEEHHVTPHKPSLHPLPTPEEEALAEKLKPIGGHIFRKADPNNPNAEKRGEFGKVLDGKVYFQHLGIWKHDPSVHATTDIISTGVKDRVKALNEANKTHHHPEEPGGARAAPPPPPAHPTTTGKRPARSWPKVNVPDALGTTEGRVQSAHTNPTKDNEREFGLGAPNRAQTGVTGQPIPEADASESRPAVPPPSHIKAELDQ